MTPALRLDRPQLHIGLRGTYLRFESGNHSLQGLFNGSFLTSTTSPWRAQLGLSGGSSSYADFASFWHALGEAQLQHMGRGRGVWIGANGGRTSFGKEPRPLAIAALGAWGRRSWISFAGSAAHTWVGDTSYTDIETTARGRRGRWVLQGLVGARLWSRGAGRGVYGEGGATLELNERAAIVVAAGRYPTDPVRGSISGRYLTAGVRLHAWRPRTRGMREPAIHVGSGSTDAGSTAELRLEARRQENGLVHLTVHAPAASTVEIAGDFTDWQPLLLSRVGLGDWHVAVRVETGPHRVDIRVNGGPWRAPEGATRLRDDYDGEVGIVLIP